jgi:phenylacetate-coenzyme A ligase PaaK-like adenylate-forming protein
MPTAQASPALERLMEAPNVYDLTPEKDARFLEAMRAAIAHHRAASPFYAALCAHAGFTELPGLDALHTVPHVFVNVLKRHELLSVPRAEVALHLTSSGTAGQKSQVFFDEGSKARGLYMIDRCFDDYGMYDRETPANYLLFAHEPAHAGTRGTAYTDHYLTKFAPLREGYFALRWSEAKQDWEFRVEEANAQLEAFAESGAPLRVLGFPAFLHRLIQFRAGRPPLAFGPRSYVLTGGGWKTSEQEAIPKEAFIAEVSAALGIPPENFRDGYGLVEHGVPYLECRHHRFHVPHFARALARHPGTLAPLREGEAGFLNLVTPYMLSMPSVSLLTSDLAAVRHGCPCGSNTATIELQGRLGTRKNKGCAITAAELLK